MLFKNATVSWKGVGGEIPSNLGLIWIRLPSGKQQKSYKDLYDLVRRRVGGGVGENHFPPYIQG